MQESLAYCNMQDYLECLETLMNTNLIGTRMKALREERKLSQDELARIFGFKDRQTVSAIENGERRVTAEELLLLVRELGASLEYFTDPFLLAGEGRFSWRQSGISASVLCAYERSAGRWIAAFRAIAPQVGLQTPLLRRALGLTRQSGFEEAMAAGERFTAEFELGDVPAARLADTMEQKLGILVLLVDTIKGVSGAACRLPELDVVLVNRNEVVGRRHFDLAHELFHILTWDVMPPDHSEESVECGGNRVEQLANNFASALLMPTRLLEPFNHWAKLSGGGLIAQLRHVADAFQVTASALKWRLVALGKLSLAAAKALSDAALRHNGVEKAERDEKDAPALFSRMFMDVVSRALEEGRVSMRRAADILDLTVDDLASLFEAYGLKSPAEL
jgi:Zn-dependent peptidase ImmA (M78 family)/DNA-binding XRE family transcriptional regulator